MRYDNFILTDAKSNIKLIHGRIAYPLFFPKRMVIVLYKAVQRTTRIFWQLHDIALLWTAFEQQSLRQFACGSCGRKNNIGKKLLDIQFCFHKSNWAIVYCAILHIEFENGHIFVALCITVESFIFLIPIELH